MTTLRFPVAAAWGAASAVAIFALLAHLVNVPIDAAPPAVARKIDFTPKTVERPVETKRNPKVERPTPPPEPGTPRVGNVGGFEAPATAWVRPAVAVVTKGGGFSLGGVDRDVIPLVRVDPEYPPRALASETEGWVQVQFTITAAGTVRDQFVVDASPKRVFDDAALRAIARWRYNPRVDHGEAVERVGMQTVIRFKLEGHKL